MQSYAIPAASSAVMARYGNIIFLDRPVHDGDLFSRRHPAMTRLNRAKIFAPFAALVGFDERVRRKEVSYVSKVELDADEEWELNRRLQILHKLTANSRLARANTVDINVEYYAVCTDSENDAYMIKGQYLTVTGKHRELLLLSLWKAMPSRLAAPSSLSSIAGQKHGKKMICPLSFAWIMEKPVSSFLVMLR